MCMHVLATSFIPSSQTNELVDGEWTVETPLSCEGSADRAQEDVAQERSIKRRFPERDSMSRTDRRGRI